ncbi:MAG: hypothetical protein ABIB71_05025 [Candidatus Woesearchaeota archaeon]
MVAISLNKGKDDIFSGYSKLETPEERKESKVEGGLLFEGFEELVKQYEEILAIDNWNIAKKALAKLAKIDSILEPDQINSFLQATVKYGDYRDYSWNTGDFITRLIQNSHEAGNNRFELNTKVLSKEIHGLGYKLKGREDNLLEIIVGGNTGYACCYEAENIGKFYIGGNAECNCGYKAKNSTFKTPIRETLQLLKTYVPKDKGNRIYFIEPNGKEKEIKEWWPYN